MSALLFQGEQGSEITMPAGLARSVSGVYEIGRYLFRGDDRYRDGPVGRALGEEADAADILDFAAHVLRKESRLSSRFTSFTTQTKIARKFTSATDNRYIMRAELAKLRELESQGFIRLWDPDQTFESLSDGPKRLAKQAADVRAAMRRNSEILIEGQVPAAVLSPIGV